MEVHHHSSPASGGAHTPKNRWAHYMWEFLMLFLAVFSGFLAEYQLEHKIERDRAKELAKSLYNEVYEDSIAMQEIIERRVIKEKGFADFSKYVKDSNLKNISISFNIAFNEAFLNNRAYVFEPKEEVLQQLINSGSLRYFKNKEVEKHISAFNVAIKRLRSRVSRELVFIDNTVKQFQFNHFDTRWRILLSENETLDFYKALQTKEVGKIPPPRILHLNEFDRDKAENIALNGFITTRSTRKNEIREYLETSHNLLMTLRRQYKMDEH